MNYDQEQLKIIQGEIAALGDEDQLRVEVMAKLIRDLVKLGGPLGGYALALVGAEMAATP